MTAEEVAEVHGYHAVGEELRKHMHGDRRPLSKVRSTGTSILVGYVKQTYIMSVHTNIVPLIKLVLLSSYRPIHLLSEEKL